MLFGQNKPDLLEELLRTHTLDADLAALRGIARSRRKQWAEAAGDLAAAIQGGRSQPEVWGPLVDCYIHLGRKDYVRTTLQQALQLFPQNDALRLRDQFLSRAGV